MNPGAWHRGAERPDGRVRPPRTTAVKRDRAPAATGARPERKTAP